MKLVNLHMVIFFLEQVQGQILGSAALVADEDHFSKPRWTPKDSMSASRIARIWAQAA